MNGNYTSGTDLFTDWRQSVTSSEQPIVYPVAEVGNPLNGVEIAPGHVTLIGAPPAAGKTSLVMQLFFDAILHSPELRGLICNVEMSPGVLMDRQLARLADIPYPLVRTRSPMDEHSDSLARGLVDIEERLKRIAFVTPPYDLPNIAGSAVDFGADLFLLDYVQRIKPSKEHNDTRLSLNSVMDTVRQIADAGYAVILVSAVARQKDSKGKSSYGGLGLASFRESSELEYGCDSAYVFDRKPDSEHFDLKCVKNRHGEPKDIPLRFVGEFQRFVPTQSNQTDPPVTIPTHRGDTWY